jgi:hypothetical protein
MTYSRWRASVVLAAGAFLVCATLVAAFDVAQSYDPATHTYTYTVTVEATDQPLRDFHIVPVKAGQRLKGTMADPKVLPDTTMNKWKTNAVKPKPSSKTYTSMTWYTEDADVGGEGDTETRDDPIPAGSIVTFGVNAGAHGGGDIRWSCTTNGSSTPPAPPTGGPAPGPIACVTPSASDETPAPGSATTVTLASTEVNSAWQVYLAASLSEPGNPATDPLGIGINTNDPIPEPLGILVTPAAGTFGEPPEPQLPIANTQLRVGAAPLGYHFYLVLVGRDADGDVELWSDPIEFVVTAP